MPAPRSPPPPLAPRLITYNPQLSSPLFTSIPPELRNDIFTFALLPYQARHKEPLDFDSYGYRPELEYPIVCAVALLATCRRIYLETHALPAALYPFFSFLLVWPERRPEGRPRLSRLECLRDEDLRNVRSLHLFAQQCALEGSEWAPTALLPSASLSLRGLAIRSLTITVRHTDWWDWESDAALRMSEHDAYGESWRQGFEEFPALEEFTMELETVERRKGEMDKLADEVRKWRIELADDSVLSTEGLPLGKRTWLGSTQFSGAQEPPPGETALPYYVVTVRWRARKDVASK